MIRKGGKSPFYSFKPKPLRRGSGVRHHPAGFFLRLRFGQPHALRKRVQITKGATRQQKAEIVKDITDSLVRVLGKKPEHTHIVIQEIADEDWGYSGMLTDDWKAAQSRK